MFVSIASERKNWIAKKTHRSQRTAAAQIIIIQILILMSGINIAANSFSAEQIVAISEQSEKAFIEASTF